jgi:hypothetical protein
MHLVLPRKLQVDASLSKPVTLADVPVPVNTKLSGLQMA